MFIMGAFSYLRVWPVSHSNGLMGGNINIPCDPEQDLQRNCFHLNHKLQASRNLCEVNVAGGLQYLQDRCVRMARIGVLGLLGCCMQEKDLAQL